MSLCHIGKPLLNHSQLKCRVVKPSPTDISATQLLHLRLRSHNRRRIDHYNLSLISEKVTFLWYQVKNAIKTRKVFFYGILNRHTEAGG